MLVLECFLPRQRLWPSTGIISACSSSLLSLSELTLMNVNLSSLVLMRCSLKRRFVYPPFRDLLKEF